MPVSHLFLFFVVETSVSYPLFESSATVLIWCKTSLASVQDHSRVCSSPELICYYIPFFSMRVFTQVMLLHCSVVKMLEVKSFSLPVYYIPNQTEGKPQTDQTSILHLPPKQPRPPPLNPKLHNLHPPPRRLRRTRALPP